MDEKNGFKGDHSFVAPDVKGKEQLVTLRVGVNELREKVKKIVEGGEATSVNIWVDLDGTNGIAIQLHTPGSVMDKKYHFYDKFMSDDQALLETLNRHLYVGRDYKNPKFDHDVGSGDYEFAQARLEGGQIVIEIQPEG